MQSSSLRVWLAFAMLCAIWGSSYLFIRIAVRQISPLALVSLRLLVGLVTVLLLVTLQGQTLRVPRRQAAVIFVIASVNTSIPFLLISWGELTVPSGLASVLNSTVPIFSVLLAGAVLHDEPVTLPRAGGVVLGFVGVILLLSRDLVHGGIQLSHLTGQGAILLSSVCYAIGPVAMRRALRGIPSTTVALYILAASAVQTTLLAAVFSRPTAAALHPDVLIGILWLGVLGSGVAYALAYFVLEHWGAARYTLVAYMLPVVGLVLGAAFLGEIVDWRIAAGSGLVIGGIVLAGLARRHPAAQVAADSRAVSVSPDA